MELENIPQKIENETEKELMEVTQENQEQNVPRATNENATAPKLPTWEELPDWAKKLVPGELIPFKGHFFKFIGMTPDLAVVLKYHSPTSKSLKE